MTRRILIYGAATLVALFTIGALVLRSDWFAEQMEKRMITELSRATGASVRIGKVSVHWEKLRFRAAPLLLQGTEPAGADPLLRAESVDVGLSLQSFLSGAIDISSLSVDGPKINLIVHADGTTNIPGGGGGQTAAQTLINMAVGRFEMRNGFAKIDERQIPLNATAEGVHAAILFEPLKREYRGNIEVKEVLSGPVHAGFESAFSFGADRAEIQRIHITTLKSSADGSGSFTDWRALKGELKLSFKADLAEVAPWLQLKSVRGGEVNGNVTGMLEAGKGWQWDGQIQGDRLVVEANGQTVKEIRGSSRVEAKGHALTFRNIHLYLLGGTFQGHADVNGQRRYKVEGDIRDIQTPAPFSATATGPVLVEGDGAQLRSFNGRLALAPRAGAVSVGGDVDIKFDGVNGQLTLGQSAVQLGNSHVSLQGSLQNGLRIEARTHNIGELLPAVRIFAPEVPAQLDVSLENELATVQMTVQGALPNPTLSGVLDAKKMKVRGETIENFLATFLADPSKINLTKVSLTRSGVALSGAIHAALDRWRIADTSSLGGSVDFQHAVVENVLKEAKIEAPLRGVALGHALISGTYGEPQASGNIQISRASIAGEPFDMVTAQFTGNEERIAISNGQAVRGANRIDGSGSWTTGAISFDVKSANWDASPYLPFKIDAAASGNLRGQLRQAGSQWTVRTLDGAVKATAKNRGNLTVTASSSGGSLHLDAQGTAQGAQISSESTWKLDGAMPGSGTVKLSGLTVAAIQSLVSNGESPIEIPFNGLVEGTASFKGDLLDPEQMTGRAVFPLVRFSPKQQTAGLTAADLTVTNSGDVALSVGPRGISVEQALFRAKDTQIESSGTLSFRRANVWNLSVRGNVNLAVFSTFKPDLISSGTSTLDARIRGTFDNPQVDGRMQFNNASFYLRDVPNGFDKVNGTILFDRTRASIETLTAESGGGNVSLTGYIGFGTELSYQLAAQVSQVRVRYPEGISSQSNASLTLAGTSRKSLLSGTVTILRAGLTPQTDASAVLSKSSRPLTAAASSNEFLRGLQFDVRVDTAQSAEFSTQLTKEVQADIELRLRGTPARPVLLGRVSITQGQVQFFGTDYKINRGEINFVNPVTIEPRVDLDLETRVRGITVSINFAGPLNKLNMSYRSDPPLQSSEILALLAVGRTPTSVTTLGAGTLNGQGLLSGGGNAILSSAMSAPSNNRLQRFFGVTRLKIDPQLIGMDNTPQSRVSLEQPISRNVTVTYVQTLARAQGQLARVQWDISKEWSALATRDENGVLSIDFIFKRSFR